MHARKPVTCDDTASSALLKSTASADEAVATSYNDISDADDELEGSGSQEDTDNGIKWLIDLTDPRE